jgi:hypothetical protein
VAYALERIDPHDVGRPLLARRTWLPLWVSLWDAHGARVADDFLAAPELFSGAFCEGRSGVYRSELAFPASAAARYVVLGDGYRRTNRVLIPAARP